MAMLEPKLAILDETDSGLDVDALRIVADGVNKLRNENNAILIITHYQRLLNYLQPDFVHILYDGRIVRSGTKDLALEIEAFHPLGILQHAGSRRAAPRTFKHLEQAARENAPGRPR